jgi:hypothetical protein
VDEHYAAFVATHTDSLLRTAQWDAVLISRDSGEIEGSVGGALPIPAALLGATPQPVPDVTLIVEFGASGVPTGPVTSSAAKAHACLGYDLVPDSQGGSSFEVRLLVAANATNAAIAAVRALPGVGQPRVAGRAAYDRKPDVTGATTIAC